MLVCIMAQSPPSHAPFGDARLKPLSAPASLDHITLPLRSLSCSPTVLRCRFKLFSPEEQKHFNFLILLVFFFFLKNSSCSYLWLRSPKCQFETRPEGILAWWEQAAIGSGTLCPRQLYMAVPGWPLVQSTVGSPAVLCQVTSWAGMRNISLNNICSL